ncbi:general transcription factor 3C polypeptide 6-like isoform X3 [Trichoplusia ni]|uniref:General transcription factor 3C polypeptide 6-like isoform X3 n=1 Tax=Trichoplusia ni TaxID=7111 RepID=A0A7E5VC16_TRINI|nr:general transcription factor 3C polypeptide 6-like isoform X3 [Trichoplusia ni]XP_026725832.1 general transcription factor 3C polypeptide 6-like isoform X3 [Trichoplusia ni]
MSDEVSESEEEYLVYAEFEDSINIEKYRAIHVLGVDGHNPIIQMDETFFTGKYDHALGTYMFFEEDPNPKSEDPLFDKLPEKNLKYLCKTRKYLNMEHAYVTPKEGHDPQNTKQELEDNIAPVNFKTLQEGIETFKNHFESESVTDVDM